MNFQFPQYLGFLFFIPCYFIFIQWKKEKYQQQLEQLGEMQLVQKLVLGVGGNKKKIQHFLYTLAFTLLVLAAANPQWGTNSQTATVRQTDFIIALDISQSMLCDDIKPNRLERAKLFLLQFLEKINAERTGLILFAGDAYVQMPLTNDPSAAALFLKSAAPDMATSQGTAIGAAIETAQRMRQESKNPCSLLIVTDGETHEEDASDRVSAAKNNGISVFFAGIGTSEGAYILIQDGAFQIAKKDENGEPVITKLNPALLEALANEGGGAYLNISQTDAKTVENWANKMTIDGKEKTITLQYKEKESRFQYFLLPALFILGFLSFKKQLM